MPRPNILKAPAPQRCAICGKRGQLERTDCCNMLVCGPVYNEKHGYWKVSRCMRGHSRYTICNQHHAEGHPGHWKDCKECRASYEPEMYAWFATNEYNTDPLKDPPPFEPTHCAACGKVIRLAHEPNMLFAGAYYCTACMHVALKAQQAALAQPPPRTQSKSRRARPPATSDI